MAARYPAQAASNHVRNYFGADSASGNARSLNPVQIQKTRATWTSVAAVNNG